MGVEERRLTAIGKVFAGIGVAIVVVCLLLIAAILIGALAFVAILIWSEI